MNHASAPTPAHLNPETWTLFTKRARLLLLVGAVVCYAVFWWCASLFQIPQHPGHGLSLVAEPMISSILLLVLLMGAVLIGTFIAGSVRFDAGLLCASVGLAALSIRGGSVRHLLLTADGPGVFLALALETALLGATLLAGWQLQWLLHRKDLLQPDEIRDGVLDTPQPLSQKLLAMLVHAAVMVATLLLVGQSDEKAQALLAVGVASFFATMASYHVGPAQPSPWFWMGSIVTGLIGYLAVYYNPAGLEIADPRGTFGNLARALPMDYASAGVAGSILAYWFSRRRHANRIVAEAQEK
jgi:hypothetical protein